MAFIGNTPTAVPLTGSQIADGTIINANIATNTINLTQKVTSALAATNGGTGTSSYTAGNILYASNATTLATLAPGTSGQALILNGTTPSWSTLGSDYVLLVSTSASNVATLDLNGYFSATYKNYKLFVEGYYGTTDVSNFRVRFATGSYTVQTTGYGDISGWAGVDSGGTEASGTTAGGSAGGSGVSFFIGHNSSNSSYRSNTEITIYDPLQTSYYHSITALTQYWNGSSTLRSANSSGTWNNTTAVTGLRLFMEAGNLYAGSVKLYGIK